MKKYTYSNPKLALEILIDLRNRLYNNTKKKKKS